MAPGDRKRPEAGIVIDLKAAPAAVPEPLRSVVRMFFGPYVVPCAETAVQIGIRHIAVGFCGHNEQVASETIRGETS